MGHRPICDALLDLVPFVQFKKSKNTHGRVLILVKLQANTCNFTKINTLPWVLFTFFNLCKWYQITQRMTYYMDGINWRNLKSLEYQIFCDYYSLSLQAQNAVEEED